MSDNAAELKAYSALLEHANAQEVIAYFAKGKKIEPQHLFLAIASHQLEAAQWIIDETGFDPNAMLDNGFAAISKCAESLPDPFDIPLDEVESACTALYAFVTMNRVDVCLEGADGVSFRKAMYKKLGDITNEFVQPNNKRMWRQSMDDAYDSEQCYESLTEKLDVWQYEQGKLPIDTYVLFSLCGYGVPLENIMSPAKWSGKETEAFALIDRLPAEMQQQLEPLWEAIRERQQVQVEVRAPNWEVHEQEPKGVVASTERGRV